MATFTSMRCMPRSGVRSPPTLSMRGSDGSPRAPMRRDPSARRWYTAPVPVTIHGETTPRFARVREAFADNFARHGEVGAACCVYHRGTMVVDLWGGLADRTLGRPWTRETAT